MDYFPLFANLKNQPCLVVGGGEVAARKVHALIGAGARVSVNAVEFCAALDDLGASGALRLHPGAFNPALIRDHVLVIAATSAREVNDAVAAAARAELRLCNIVDEGPASTFIVPAVIDRSPVIVAITSGGRAPVLARLMRQRLERWLPGRLGDLADWAGGWRERVKGQLPEIGPRRAFWEQLLGGPAAAEVLRGDVAAADRLATRILDGHATEPTPGRAWLVGAGPGDPGLITVRGLEILQHADVILHDRLIAPELLRSARREAEIICVGKTGRAPSTRQEDINDLLIARVRAGRKVCRLKGGDPLTFGRGGEEALALAAAGLPFEIVPGITAASGCGAYAGIPLTHRGLATAVTLVTAQAAPGAAGPDWPHLAAARHTLAIYMGGARVGEIVGELMRHGREPATPAAVIANGTTARQQVVTGTLADIVARSAGCHGISPSLLIVGETAALATALTWRTEPDLGILSGEPSGGPLSSASARAPAAFIG